MKGFADKIQVSDKTKEIINTILIFISGILLGILSKWLDNLNINDAIWWQHILGILDLRNVFSDFEIWIFLAVTISVFSKSPLRASLNVFLFFVGMTTSYHLHTIMYSGFNPKSYMMIWYGITAITPILAFICWYAKGNKRISIIISSIILSVMLIVSFSIGFWYFDFKSIINTLLFLGTIIILYTKPEYSIYSLLFAIILSFIYEIILYMI